jgi:hypothetical protein
VSDQPAPQRQYIQPLGPVRARVFSVVTVPLVANGALLLGREARSLLLPAGLLAVAAAIESRGTSTPDDGSLRIARRLRAYAENPQLPVRHIWSPDGPAA